jgi:hypothetical protein
VNAAIVSRAAVTASRPYGRGPFANLSRLCGSRIPNHIQPDQLPIMRFPRSVAAAGFQQGTWTVRLGTPVWPPTWPTGYRQRRSPTGCGVSAFFCSAVAPWVVPITTCFGSLPMNARTDFPHNPPAVNHRTCAHCPTSALGPPWGPVKKLPHCPKTENAPALMGHPRRIRQGPASEGCPHHRQPAHDHSDRRAD